MRKYAFLNLLNSRNTQARFLLLSVLLVLAGFVQMKAQIKFDSANDYKLAEMGVERVAMYFTPAYKSTTAKSNDETRWVQIDLGKSLAIDGIKLLPKVIIPGSFIRSEGFPERFKIEISDTPDFSKAITYEDYTRQDYKDPYDQVCNFSGKEIIGRYVRLTAVKLRQNQLALTKFMIMSKGKDVAENCLVSDSESGEWGLNILTRPQRPQGEGVVTNNPENVIPVDKWQPVAYKVNVPLNGITLGDGLFKKAMDNNIDYLMSSLTLDELKRNFYLKAGKPVNELDEKRNNFWMVDIPGSEVGRFLMGAGNTLRWTQHPALRNRMDELVDVIDECKEPNGYIMAYPKDKIFNGEFGAYTRSWVTHGLIEAGYAGNKKAFSLLRGFYDWFNVSPYLPELLRRGGQGTQGKIPNTRMYFTPVGKPEDIQVVQQYFQENYWIEQLAKREPKAIWLYPYDRPHSYLITGIEPELDMYRATGARKYLDAAMGSWDLFHDSWEHIGGSIAVCEGHELYPPKSYYLTRGTGELCGNVFWSFFNQRFHCLYPDEEKYVAEIEKSIYNVLLPNQDSSIGIRYIANLAGHRGRGDHTNTCCEGQGTRMLGALPEFIYSLNGDNIYINLFSASSINNNSVALKMETQFPFDASVKISVSTDKPSNFKIFLRIPSWADATMPVFINGKKFITGKPGTYLALSRIWKSGDEIRFTLPMNFKLTKYTGVDVKENAERYALEYGPLLMACTNIKATDENIELPFEPNQLIKNLDAVSNKPLHFYIKGNSEFEFMPYFDIKSELFTCFPYIKKVAEK